MTPAVTQKPMLLGVGVWFAECHHAQFTNEAPRLVYCPQARPSRPWFLKVGGVICLLNSVTERDLTSASASVIQAVARHYLLGRS